MDKILHKTYDIFSRDSDNNSRLKYSAVINFFIHAAWHHANDLGFGYNHLSENGMAWVLSRFKVVFKDVPYWPGEIEISTWPKGVKRLFYIRDAELKSENKTFAQITSYWLIINKENKRPKLYRKENMEEMASPEKVAVDKDLGKLNFNLNNYTKFNFEVKYNDIDVNQHLTTVRYIEFLFDTYDLDYLKINKLKELSVNFIKEIKVNSKLEMRREIINNKHLFELINTTKYDTYFRAELLF